MERNSLFGICLGALTCLGFISFGMPSQADILNQRVLFDQDPWDPQSQLGSSNCHTNPDGSMTCDTRPRGQVWVESYGVGYN
jgi:hypothetical protein